MTGMCSEMGYTLLIVDDEPAFLDSVKRVLRAGGFKNVITERDPQQAFSLFEREKRIDVALIDVTMPQMDGVELLEVIRNMSPDTECLMVTALNDAKVATECIKKGAYDYLVKPLSADDLLQALNRALERKRLLDILEIKKKQVPELAFPEVFQPIITRSVKVRKILKEAELHARSSVPVLITGESGTGKELLAKAVHDASTRSKGPFVAVNMAAPSGSLFDAEFFGHTKGAFTGAEKERRGYLEAAHKGSLFLDEIGYLKLELQGKLLRLLQEGEFLKPGSSRLQKVDIRFLAATNNDLEGLIRKGQFRKDLYYRLKGAWLHLPALRERKEDIPLLIDHFLAEFNGTGGGGKISEQVLSVFMDYEYPGNIRELRSIIQGAVNLAQGHALTLHCLPRYLRKQKGLLQMKRDAAGEGIVPLHKVEKAHILEAYGRTGRNKTRTARCLGIGLNSLRRKLKSYGVE